LRVAAKTEFVPDKWQAFGHVPLSAADAVECGYTRAAAEALVSAAFPGESGLTLAQAKKELGTVRPSSPPGKRLAAQILEEIVDYRAERAKVAGDHQAIRLAKANLKKLLKGSDVTVPQLRMLAEELGWNVREDEEGVTVPVNELIPYFRRPVVRQLLAAKMRQIGRGARELGPTGP
jgi:hypothetical protein